MQLTAPSSNFALHAGQIVGGGGDTGGAGGLTGGRGGSPGGFDRELTDSGCLTGGRWGSPSGGLDGGGGGAIGWRGRGHTGGRGDEGVLAERAAKLLPGRIVGHLHLLLAMRATDHVWHGGLVSVHRSRNRPGRAAWHSAGKRGRLPLRSRNRPGRELGISRQARPLAATFVFVFTVAATGPVACLALAGKRGRLPLRSFQVVTFSSAARRRAARFCPAESGLPNVAAPASLRSVCR